MSKLIDKKLLNFTVRILKKNDHYSLQKILSKYGSNNLIKRNTPLVSTDGSLRYFWWEGFHHKKGKRSRYLDLHISEDLLKNVDVIRVLVKQPYYKIVRHPDHIKDVDAWLFSILLKSEAEGV